MDISAVPVPAPIAATQKNEGILDILKNIFTVQTGGRRKAIRGRKTRRGRRKSRRRH